jgi:hypothetical protein
MPNYKHATISHSRLLKHMRTADKPQTLEAICDCLNALPLSQRGYTDWRVTETNQILREMARDGIPMRYVQHLRVWMHDDSPAARNLRYRTVVNGLANFGVEVQQHGHNSGTCIVNIDQLGNLLSNIYKAGKARGEQ